MSNGFDLHASSATMWQKFTIYKAVVRAIAEGNMSTAIVKGPPGLGKTYEAEAELRPFVLSARLKVTRTAGHTTPLSLYNALYDHRGSDEVLILDDCDDAFKSNVALNILKAAADTRSTRMISWMSTASEKKIRVPQFRYDGRLIIITNADMSGKAFKPLLDRAFIVDMTLTPEERLARVLEILYKDQKHLETVRRDVSDWIQDNYLRLGENLTCRTAVKCLQLAGFDPTGWRQLASATLIVTV